MSIADDLAALRDGIDHLTHDECRHTLHGLAARMPEQVLTEAAYVHERRVWYPDPPVKET